MVFRGPRAAAPTVALHFTALKTLSALRCTALRCSNSSHSCATLVAPRPIRHPLRLGRDQSGTAGGHALAPALLSSKPSAWRLGAAAGGAWHNAARMPMFKTAFNGYSVRPPFSSSSLLALTPSSISVTNFFLFLCFPLIQYLGTCLDCNWRARSEFYGIDVTISEPRLHAGADWRALV
jgi:hypothetical protein